MGDRFSYERLSNSRRVGRSGGRTVLPEALVLVPLLLTAGCGPAEGDSGVDLGDPPEELVLPDVSGVDFPAAFRDAVQLTKRITAGVAWQGHVAALGERSADCPDVYAGAPDDPSVDVGEEGGLSWFDHCSTPAGTDFDGWAWWTGAVAVAGDAATPEGATTEASRTVAGDAALTDHAGVRFELDGEASDALSRTDAPDYARWTYSSTVTGTVTGATLFGDDPETPGGWRTDLAVYATGGDAAVYEPRGNVFLFDRKLHDRFDSFELDLAFAGAGAQGPDDCALEPRGWIGLRDENAYWYDVVFLPRSDEDPNDTGDGNAPYTACDGCGTLYVRGVEVTELGEVCLDPAFVWDVDPFTPPAVEDFVLSLRQLESEDR